MPKHYEPTMEEFYEEEPFSLKNALEDEFYRNPFNAALAILCITTNVLVIFGAIVFFVFLFAEFI